MIPKTFHFVFGLREQKEPFNLMYYLCLASCIEVNRPEAVYFHYHHEPWGEWWDRIKPLIRLRKIELDSFVSDFKYTDSSINQYRYAHLADFSRLQILFQEGGIYADIDTIFLRPIPEVWFCREFILGREKPPTGASDSLCNAWIASIPGSEFCQRWIDGMVDAFDGSWSNHSTLLPCRLANEHPEIISVEPEISFYAIDHTPEGIDDLFIRNVSLPEDSYSLHLWNHLWFDRKRRDFSDFHGNLLNQDYVAFSDSTYAIHARRFLPSDVKVSRARFLMQTLEISSRRSLRNIRNNLSRLSRCLPL